MPKVWKAIITYVSCLVAAGGQLNANPTRSECIAAYEMDWSEVQGDPTDIANAMRLPSGSHRIEPLIAYRTSLDLARLYLQFSADCDKRYILAAQLLDIWRSQNLELPTFHPIRSQIRPSPDTIDVQGPYWSDGMPDGILDPDFPDEPAEADL
jgi:hypothetical protein